MVKIYTKAGDAGESALFGGGRVSKDHPRLEAYGTLDELNSVVGWALAAITERDMLEILRGTQSRLFDLGAHLATPKDAIKAESVLPVLDAAWTKALEKAIDTLEKELPALDSFVLPGGTEASSRLHIARVVCRRAERRVVEIPDREDLDPVILPYLNRLSDFLFVAARAHTRREGAAEVPWKPIKP